MSISNINKRFLEQIKQDCLYKNFLHKYKDKDNFYQLLLKAGAIEEDLTETDIEAIRDYRLLTLPIINRKSDSKRPKAIVVSTGSYSPMHLGHVDSMESAKDYIENILGYEVLQGVMSLSHDGYVSIKNNGIAKLHIGERTQKAYEILKDNSWITIDRFEGEFVSTPINFSTVLERVRNYLLEHHPLVSNNVKVFYVFGADNASFAYSFVNNDKYEAICLERGIYDFNEVKKELSEFKNIHFVKNQKDSKNLSSTEVRKSIKIDNDKISGKRIYLIRKDDVSNDFASKLSRIIKCYVKDDVEIRLFDSNDIKNIKTDKSISLDKYIKGQYNLDVSRVFNLSDSQMKAFDMTSLKADFDIQIKDIPECCYTLIDDDTVSGFTINFIRDLLKRYNIEINNIEILTSQILKEDESLYDIIDARDFMFNQKIGGLVVQSFNGKNIRVPYVAPIVNLTSRASVKPEYQLLATKEILELNKEIVLSKNNNDIFEYLNLSSVEFINLYIKYLDNYLREK